MQSEHHCAEEGGRPSAECRALWQQLPRLPVPVRATEEIVASTQSGYVDAMWVGQQRSPSTPPSLPVVPSSPERSQGVAVEEEEEEQHHHQRSPHLSPRSPHSPQQLSPRLTPRTLPATATVPTPTLVHVGERSFSAAAAAAGPAAAAVPRRGRVRTLRGARAASDGRHMSLAMVIGQGSTTDRDGAKTSDAAVGVAGSTPPAEGESTGDSGLGFLASNAASTQPRARNSPGITQLGSHSPQNSPGATQPGFHSRENSAGNSTDSSRSGDRQPHEGYALPRAQSHQAIHRVLEKSTEERRALRVASLRRVGQQSVV